MLEVDRLRGVIRPKPTREYKDYRDIVAALGKVGSDPSDVFKLESYTSVTFRHAQALVMLKELPDKQLELAQRIVAEKLAGPQALREADKILNPEKYVREAKPWVCSMCEKEQIPEEAKTKVELCPECYANLFADRATGKSGGFCDNENSSC